MREPERARTGCWWERAGSGGTHYAAQKFALPPATPLELHSLFSANWPDCLLSGKITYARERQMALAYRRARCDDAPPACSAPNLSIAFALFHR